MSTLRLQKRRAIRTELPEPMSHVTIPGAQIAPLPFSALDRIYRAIEPSFAHVSQIQDICRQGELSVVPSHSKAFLPGGLRCKELNPGGVGPIYVKLEAFSRAPPVQLATLMQRPEVLTSVRSKTARCELLYTALVSSSVIHSFRVTAPGPFCQYEHTVTHIMKSVENGSVLLLLSPPDLGPEVANPALKIMPVPFAAYLMRPQPFIAPDGSVSTGSSITILLEALPENFPGIVAVLPPSAYMPVLARLIEKTMVATIQAASSLFAGNPCDFVLSYFDNSASDIFAASSTSCSSNPNHYPLTAEQEYYRLDHLALTSMLHLIGEVVTDNLLMNQQLERMEQEFRGRRRGRQKGQKVVVKTKKKEIKQEDESTDPSCGPGPMMVKVEEKLPCGSSEDSPNIST